MSADERDGDVATKALPWLAPLPWHEVPMREALAHRDTWPHALLIHGPRGIGKHALALGLAQALLCEAPRADGLACGECPGCRYAIAGEHPDLMRLELLDVDPKDDELKPVDEIKIHRVRKLIDFVALSSHRHRAKVGVIVPAERMNVQAANALLETLEEPPPRHVPHPGGGSSAVAAGDDRQPLPQDGRAAARAGGGRRVARRAGRRRGRARSGAGRRRAADRARARRPRSTGRAPGVADGARAAGAAIRRRARFGHRRRRA